MVLGLGIDVIEIERIRKVFDKRGEKYIKKIFTEREIEYSYKHKEPYLHLAGRFSSKEAYYKSVGFGVLSFGEIEVANEETGKPYIILHGKTLAQWEEIGRPNIHLSLSHTDTVAAAVVVLEQSDND